MKRTAVAAAWIAGSTVPLLAATMFLIGCCVLPFHRVVHKLMPLCEMAASVVRADPSQHDDHEHDATPAAPAQQKEEPVKRIATSLPETFRLTTSTAARTTLEPASETAYRSFISLGAVRCDQDVGLHVLVETFRI